MIRKVAALVIGVALAFGAGAYAGSSAQEPSAPAKHACCQPAQGGHADHAMDCCKDGTCGAQCGDCAKGECKTCKSADCCKGMDCCKDGTCARSKDAPKDGCCANG